MTVEEKLTQARAEIGALVGEAAEITPALSYLLDALEAIYEDCEGAHKRLDLIARKLAQP